MRGSPSSKRRPEIVPIPATVPYRLLEAPPSRHAPIAPIYFRELLEEEGDDESEPPRRLAVERLFQ